MDLHDHVIRLHEECTRLCAELKGCLEEERRLLIEFRVSEIAHVTLRKESLVLSLTRKRSELKEFLKVRHGFTKVSQYGEALGAQKRGEWERREVEWKKVWAETRETVRRNQDFLKASLKSLGLLADNLKRCLGEPSLYNAKGARQEAPGEGKVVQASY